MPDQPSPLPLPGFEYDYEKKKYFRIQKTGLTTAGRSSKFSVSAVAESQRRVARESARPNLLPALPGLNPHQAKFAGLSETSVRARAQTGRLGEWKHIEMPQEAQNLASLVEHCRGFAAGCGQSGQLFYVPGNYASANDVVPLLSQEHLATQTWHTGAPALTACKQVLIAAQTQPDNKITLFTGSTATAYEPPRLSRFALAPGAQGETVLCMPSDSQLVLANGSLLRLFDVHGNSSDGLGPQSKSWKTLRGIGVSCAAPANDISANGALLGTTNGDIQLLDVREPKPQMLVKARANEQFRITNIVPTRGPLYVVARLGQIQPELVDARMGVAAEPVLRYDCANYDQATIGMATSKDGTALAACDDQGIIKLFDVASGHPLLGPKLPWEHHTGSPHVVKALCWGTRLGALHGGQLHVSGLR